MDSAKILFRDKQEFDIWLTSLARQVNVKKDMPFDEFLMFQSFFGATLLDNSGEPLLEKYPNKLLKQFPEEIGLIQYGEAWAVNKLPKSYPCVASTWFERRGNLSITSIRYVYPEDFADSITMP